MKLILMLYNERIRIIFGIFCLMFKGSGIAISGGFTNIDTIAPCESSLVGVQRKTFLNFILIFFT